MTDAFVVDMADLCKSYGPTEAVRGLNLQVPAGSIYGFLGRNGAGKTTTIKMLLGMTRPTSGVVRVFGLAADAPGTSVEIRRRTGFVSEDKDLYDSMTVEEIVRFTAAFFPQWRTDLEHRYLRSFDLPPTRKVKALSRGMRTKLALLLALSRGAELLILDEPTSGLDPAMTEEVLQALVAHVGSTGMTVFFSSHQIAEVDQIADHVAIIDRGRTAVAGPLDEVRERYRRIQLIFDDAAPSATFRSPGVERVQRNGRVLSVICSAGAERIVEEARTLGPVSVEVAPITLRDIFLETVATEETEMLWYKSWLDTRWRFLIGLALLMGSASSIVLAYPRVMELLPLVPAVETRGEIGRRIREAAELSSTYRGYVWSQWFRQQPTQIGTLFAVLLGTGGLLSQSAGGALFTLSLPVSRERLLAVRAAAGLAELFVLAFLPSLVIPMLSPAVGQTFGIGSAIVHALCWFVAGAVFFSLAILLSTVFGDVWRPLLVACAAAFALAMCDFVFRSLAPYSIFRVMSAESYFRTGSVPWLGLFASAAVSAAVLYGAAVNFARRDF